MSSKVCQVWLMTASTSFVPGLKGEELPKSMRSFEHSADELENAHTSS